MSEQENNQECGQPFDQELIRKSVLNILTALGEIRIVKAC